MMTDVSILHALGGVPDSPGAYLEFVRHAKDDDLSPDFGHYVCRLGAGDEQEGGGGGGGGREGDAIGSDPAEEGQVLLKHQLARWTCMGRS